MECCWRQLQTVLHGLLVSHSDLNCWVGVYRWLGGNHALYDLPVLGHDQKEQIGLRVFHQ